METPQTTLIKGRSVRQCDMILRPNLRLRYGHLETTPIWCRVDRVIGPISWGGIKLETSHGIRHVRPDEDVEIQLRPAADCCWRCGADLHGDHSRGTRLIDLEWRSLCATCDDAKETTDDAEV